MGDQKPRTSCYDYLSGIIGNSRVLAALGRGVRKWRKYMVAQSRHRPYPSHCRIAAHDVAPTSTYNFLFLQVAFLSWNLGQLVSPINSYMSGKADGCLGKNPGRVNTRRGPCACRYDQPEYRFSWKITPFSIHKQQRWRWKMVFQDWSQCYLERRLPHPPPPHPHPSTLSIFNAETLRYFGRSLKTHFYGALHVIICFTEITLLSE